MAGVFQRITVPLAGCLGQPQHSKLPVNKQPKYHIKEYINQRGADGYLKPLKA